MYRAARGGRVLDRMEEHAAHTTSRPGPTTSGRAFGATSRVRGSRDYLESAGKAVQFLGHMGVEVYCTNEEHPVKVLALGEPFTLTFDQAKAIGLRVPPSEPPM